MTHPELSSPDSLQPPLLPIKPTATSDKKLSIFTNSNDSEAKGYLFVFLSCIGYTAMTIAIDAAENSYHVQPFVIILVRGLVQLMLAVLGMLLLCIKSPLENFKTKQQWQALIVHGVFSGLTTIFFAYSLKYVYSAEASTLYFSSPIFIMMLSSILLKEPVTKMDVSAVLLCFAGVFFLSKPSFEATSTRYIGVIFGISAAAASSIALICIRWVGEGVHFLSFVAALSMFELMFVAPVSVSEFLRDVVSKHTGMLLAILSGVAGFFAHSCISIGLQHCNAGRGALIRTFDVPILYLLGVLFLGEKADALRLIGSFLVICGAVLIAIQQMRQAHEAAPCEDGELDEELFPEEDA